MCVFFFVVYFENGEVAKCYKLRKQPKSVFVNRHKHEWHGISMRNVSMPCVFSITMKVYRLSTVQLKLIARTECYHLFICFENENVSMECLLAANSVG